MASLLERLREKPPSQRRLVAVLAASGITLVLFFVWVSVFFSNFEGVIGGEAGDIQETAAPLSSLGNDVSSIFKQIQEGFDAIKAATSTAGTTPPVENPESIFPDTTSSFPTASPVPSEEISQEENIETPSPASPQGPLLQLEPF